ncbi:hypothetical protein MWU65_05030 [Cellulophaga sp. F20128]|uniref:hypothetical protein n=1 Tax=Cellulophaga sp. F20128 TaxID=2926413 RepID=UPI001FF4CBB5|nr:hypothetical protein [Cellulophaga sp. F20128]MCK0156531.1 hypothetical protein [Cellulophaga sp. F20128]
MEKEILTFMDKQLKRIQKSKELLLVQGVKKLQIIGFTNVTMHNILTDETYRIYFLSFLKNRSISKTDDEINAIKELKSFIAKLLKM